MSDYRFKNGPIPDETFENDCGAPDPERTEKSTSSEGASARKAHVTEILAYVGEKDGEGD